MVAVLLSVLVAGCVSVVVASLFWRIRSQRSLSATAAAVEDIPRRPSFRFGAGPFRGHVCFQRGGQHSVRG